MKIFNRLKNYSYLILYIAQGKTKSKKFGFGQLVRTQKYPLRMEDITSVENELKIKLKVDNVMVINFAQFL
jgi:hypothetical protein